MCALSQDDDESTGEPDDNAIADDDDDFGSGGSDDGSSPAVKAKGHDKGNDVHVRFIDDSPPSSPSSSSNSSSSSSSSPSSPSSASSSSSSTSNSPNSSLAESPASLGRTSGAADADPSNLVGQRLVKYFDGQGDFKGTVVSNRGRYFQVVYEDGDKEDLNLAEVLSFLEVLAKPLSTSLTPRPSRRRQTAATAATEPPRQSEKPVKGGGGGVGSGKVPPPRLIRTFQFTP